MMGAAFQMPFHARWADMDFNAHMRNTAFLEVAADCRIRYFDEGGFTMRAFERWEIGPVVTRDQVEYSGEMRLLETGVVDLQLAGLNHDASRFRLRNTLRRDRDGTRVAVVTTSGAWLNLASRSPTPPPADLLRLLEALPRTLDFAVL